MADLLKGEMFMENYNEAFFRAKTNKRASITWVLLLIVACIYYGIKVGTGTLTPGYYAAFAIVGWAVYIVGQALLFIKGMDFKPYKLDCGTGISCILFGHCMDGNSTRFHMCLSCR